MAKMSDPIAAPAMCNLNHNPSGNAFFNIVIALAPGMKITHAMTISTPCVTSRVNVDVDVPEFAVVMPVTSALTVPNAECFPGHADVFIPQMNVSVPGVVFSFVYRNFNVNPFASLVVASSVIAHPAEHTFEGVARLVNVYAVAVELAPFACPTDTTADDIDVPGPNDAQPDAPGFFVPLNVALT